MKNKIIALTLLAVFAGVASSAVASSILGKQELAKHCTVNPVTHDEICWS